MIVINDILLVLGYLLQTYFYIYFFHIFSLYSLNYLYILYILSLHSLHFLTHSAEFKNYFKKVPVMTNNTLKKTIGFIKHKYIRQINPIIFEHSYITQQIYLHAQELIYLNIHLRKLVDSIC